MCACVSALQTLTSLTVMMRRQRARTLWTVLPWQPVSKHTLVSLCTCKCICMRACVFTHGYVCEEDSQAREENEKNKQTSVLC